MTLPGRYGTGWCAARCRAIAALTLLLATHASAQEAAQARARRTRVEHGLRSTIIVSGSSRGWSLAERMAHYRVPAVSIAVIDNGRIEWARAYGVANVVEARTATTETLFQAASVSKPLTALAALHLVEQQRITLDGDVNTWLRSWQVPSDSLTAQQPVTVRELLTHTAGLTVHGFPGYAANEAVPTLLQVLNGADPANTPAIRVDTRPGTQWRYSGGGYTVLQQLLIDVSGMPFPQLLRQLVLDPMGMTRSTYSQPLEPLRAHEAASGYRTDGSAIPHHWHTYPEMAAAGLWTTPTDLARYILEVQAAWAGRSRRVISPDMARQMLTAGTGGWGLGPQLGGSGDSLHFQHGGANEGFRCEFIGSVTGGRGAVVMTNSDAGSLIVNEILLAIGDVYGWPDVPRSALRPVALPDSVASEYVGRYHLPAQAGGVLAVAWRDGGLVAIVGDLPASPLVHTGEDAFIGLDNGTSLRFIRENGRIVAAGIYGVRAQRMASQP